MKLLFVDDQVMFCESVAQLLELNTHRFYSLPISIDFVHTLEDAIPAVQNEEEEERPDFVFLDLNLDEENAGYTTFTKFGQINTYGIRTILLTGIVPREREDIDILRKCTAAPFLGGIILKAKPMKAAYEGLEQIFRGQFWAPNDVRVAIGSLDPNHEPQKPAPVPQEWKLARHEWLVANELCLGNSSKVIAYNLDRNYDYVRGVCSSIYRKLGVSNRVAAVIMIEKARALDPSLGRL